MQGCRVSRRVPPLILNRSQHSMELMERRWYPLSMRVGGPQPTWTFWRNCLSPAGIRTTDRPVPSLVFIPTTLCQLQYSEVFLLWFDPYGVRRLSRKQCNRGEILETCSLVALCVPSTVLSVWAVLCRHVFRMICRTWTFSSLLCRICEFLPCV